MLQCKYASVLPHHLANHHDVRAQVFVHSEDVKQSYVPINDIDTVDDPPVAHQRRVLQAEHHPDGEDENGHEVSDVPVLLQPHFHLLQELAWLGHENLIDGDSDTATSSEQL